METFVYPAVVAAICLACGIVLWMQHRRAARISRERDAIEGEEHRLFHFLHGLGAALLEDSSPRNMHRIIVDGVSNVVDAEAGALYLLDRSGTELVPMYITDNAPPLLELPESIAKTAEKNPEGLRSFLRLAAAGRDEGLLGEALAGRRPLNIERLSEHPSFRAKPSMAQVDLAVLIAPLVYAQKELGVLAVARNGAKGFSPNDFDVFSSVSEQSSFALGSALIHKEAHEKRRLEDELRNAFEIQRILLPETAPDLEDYDLAGTNIPAKIVSGDYYDYVPVDSNHFGAVIGDVCGKGIPASLIMAMCRSVLRANASGNHSAADVLHQVNRLIFPDIREDMFVSLAYLILERGSREIVMARAGHEPPLIYRKAEDRIETLNPPGLAAGIDAGEVFERVVVDYKFEMAPGDVLLLYTDGVTETLRADGEMYGLDRLKVTLKESAPRGAQAVVESVHTAVKEFMAGWPQNDDITLIVIKKR